MKDEQPWGRCNDALDEIMIKDNVEILVAEYERKAIGLYAVLARDPVDFIEMCGEASQNTLSVLWKMLTIYNPNSDNELNELGASLIEDMVENKDL